MSNGGERVVMYYRNKGFSKEEDQQCSTQTTTITSQICRGWVAVGVGTFEYWGSFFYFKLSVNFNELYIINLSPFTYFSICVIFLQLSSDCEYLSMYLDGNRTSMSR